MDRYGAQAIYGRPLTVREVREMVSAQNVYEAVKALRGAESWAAFSHADKRQFDIASYAIGLLHHA